jgi:uncharacterized protein (DUF1684 family)
MTKTVMLLAFLGLATLSACDRAPPAATEDAAAKARHAAWVKDVRDERAGRLQRLQKPDGWLSLVGMHWLQVGNSRVGSGADNGTRLDVGPPRLGLVRLERDGRLQFTPEPGVEVTANGEPVTGPVPLVADVDAGEAGPTVIGFNKGDASFIVIKRGDRYALRVRDALAPTRSGFPGIAYFDLDPSFRVEATFKAHPPGKKIDILNVLGMTEPMDNPGTVTFTHGGKSFTMEAVDEGDHRLFLNFADRTSGHESYPAARYLYAEYPDASGKTIIDFNKTYNPPCAFTDFATCPLPPPQNRLDLAIRAGEKKPLKNPLVEGH